MHKLEQTISLLQKIEQAIERIVNNSSAVDSYQFYYLTPSGMERLESTCMLLIAIGESVKGVDKLTGKELLLRYPEIDWKGAMGIRDIIAHHYFDLDGEIVFDVVKNNLPPMLETIRRMTADVKKNIECL